MKDPEPAAHFTRRPDGYFVKVWSEKDLTGEKIPVSVKGGKTKLVRLAELLEPAVDGVAIYSFKQYTTAHKEELRDVNQHA